MPSARPSTSAAPTISRRFGLTGDVGSPAPVMTVACTGAVVEAVAGVVPVATGEAFELRYAT